MKNMLLKKICDRLNEAGITDMDYSDILSPGVECQFNVDSERIATISSLPLDNLKRISECDITSCSNYAEVYQMWGRLGMFKFKPYIVDENWNPTLCLRHNRFLHMFRGYYFQISETVDGIGEWSRGPYRTEGLIKLIRTNGESYRASHLMFLMMYASMIHCGFSCDAFVDLFYSDRELVDKFFALSMKYWGIEFTVDSSIISNYIEYSDKFVLEQNDVRQVVYQYNSKRGPMCRFTLNHAIVSVEYNPDANISTSKIVQCSIPSIVTGMDERQIGLVDEYTLDWNGGLEDAISKYETPAHWILLMILNLTGIHANFMGAYPTKKLGCIPVLTGEYVGFKDLNVIDNK